MIFKNCTFDNEHIKNEYTLSELLELTQPTNLKLTFPIDSYFKNSIYTILGAVAKRLSWYLMIVNYVEGDKFDIIVDYSFQHMTLDWTDANIVQGELYDVINPESILFNNKLYDGFNYMTPSETSKVIEWPDSQTLIDDGVTVLMINDKLADKMLRQPAYVVLK